MHTSKRQEKVVSVTVALCLLLCAAATLAQDCNENGVDDTADIANMTSLDCDGNGLPDECQIPKWGAAPGGPYFCTPWFPPAPLAACDPDCNGTGVPDACELTDNDCNADGVPDECGAEGVCHVIDTTFTWPAPLNSYATSDTYLQEGEPELATDGQGTWLAVWHARGDFVPEIGLDYDIIFSRSTDGGVTWSLPSLLNANATTDSAIDYMPDVASDGSGTWVAVWYSKNDSGGVMGADYDILVARSTDGGIRWSAPAPLNRNATRDSGDDLRPKLIADGSGTWVAVWVSDDDLDGTIGTDDDILFARSADGGVTWSEPAALNGNATTDSVWDREPQVTTDGLGNWVAVWQAIGGDGPPVSEVLFAHSTDGGVTWSAPAPIAASGANEGVPDVSTDGLGNWTAVWAYSVGEPPTDGGIVAARSTDGGATWDAPVPLIDSLAGPTSEVSSVRIMADGVGNWVAVWASADYPGATIGLDTDLVFVRSTDGGVTWTAPAPLNGNAATDSGTDGYPELITDGLGTWVVVWLSDDDLGRTIGTDYDILFARSVDAGSTWTMPAPLSGTAVTDSGDDTDPQLTTDGLGTWVAVWCGGFNLGGTIGTDDDILFARSTDDGATWTASEPLNGNAATDWGHDTNPQVTTNGWGTWVSVWVSSDDLGGTIGADEDILFARSVDGGVTWTTPAPLNRNATSDSALDVAPQLTTDRLGNWVAVWQSGEYLISSHFDVLFARSIDGGVTWSDPTPLNTNAAIGSGRDRFPQVTTDGAGTWVAVWQSADDLGGTIGTDDDILSARSTDDGVTWSPPAPLNTNAATDSDSDSDQVPQLTTDGLGNWIAVWRLYQYLPPSYASVLFARSTDGGMTWTAPAPLDGDAGTASGSVFDPQITTDGFGNWVAVWASSDDLGGAIGVDRDILSVRSTDGGVTWTAPAPLNRNAALDSGFDNAPQLTTDGSGNWVLAWSSYDDLNETIGTDTDVLFARITNFGADCDCNGVADACDIAGGAPDANGNGVPDECEYVAPEPLMATGEAAATNRYLRFSAPGGGGAAEEVIRVRCVSLDGFPSPPTDMFYLGGPFAAPEEDQTQPGLTFTAAPLSCTPYAHDWSGEGIISAYGAEIMPGSVYEVQRAGVGCADLLNNEACWSAPLAIETAKYGDVWPVFHWENISPQPDFNDITAMVNKFLAAGAAAAPIKAVAQLQPNSVFPDRVIDFKDIAADVEAFFSTPYSASYPGPCACPSSVTCGTTACTSDLVCGDGLCIAGFCTDPCGRCTPPVAIETVPVGNPGNAGENSGGSEPGGYGPDRICGAVDYIYNIGKYEVTAGQYTAFLNSVAADDTYSLYHTYMWTGLFGCKIEQLGSPGSYTYTVAPDWSDRPVNYVSWGDAARFANWLHNGQPTGAQDLTTTEDGSYYLNGAMTDVELMAVVREPDATWVIPSEDEWYKAAYHYNDGTTGNYYDYPTSSDSFPSRDLIDPDPGNNATFYYAGYTIDSPYYRTEIGAHENSDSPYGTFDQGGNLWEWNEAIINSWFRGVRGGSFSYGVYDLHAAYRHYYHPMYGTISIGFRVAEVP